MFKNSGIYHTWLRICSISVVFLHVYCRNRSNNAGKHRYLPHVASYMRKKYRVFACFCSDLLQYCSKAPLFTTRDLRNVTMTRVFDGLRVTWPQEWIKTPLFTIPEALVAARGSICELPTAPNALKCASTSSQNSKTKSQELQRL